MTTQGGKKIIDLSKWAGVTYDGKSLDDYFSEEKEKEKDKEIIENIKTETKHRKKIRAKARYDNYTRGASKMTNLPQNQVNKEYLEKFLDRAKGLKQQVVLLLISGGEWYADKMIEVLESKKKYSKQQIWNVLSDIMRCEFSNYIKRRKVVIEGNKQYEYRCTDEGCNLTPKEAHELAATKKKKTKSILKPAKKKQKPLFTQKEANDLAAKTRLEPEKQSIDEDQITPSMLESLAKQTLNIVVSGGIEITFHLKLR